MPDALPSPFTVAAVQAAPVFLNREATVEKTCRRIAEAAGRGARLVVFPESFIPCFPDWVWLALPTGDSGEIHNRLYIDLLANAVAVPSAATDRLGEAARDAGAHVVIGVTEVNAEASGASLYNTLLFFGPDGSLLGKHRKLIPTSAERLVWGQGTDGGTLRTYDTPLGKLGGLICWENYMPLARYALYARGVQLYVAATWDCGDVWLATLRHVAKEGRTFVLGCCTALRAADLPDTFTLKDQLYPDPDEWINPGGSAIVGPDGKLLAGPVLEREEILYAEVDLRRSIAGKRTLDVAGHYARPDVFELIVHDRARPILAGRGRAAATEAGAGHPLSAGPPSERSR
jgi:nitrilase